jgi:GDP-L-fucose synthase
MVEYNITENLNVGIEENLTIDNIAKIALQATNSNHLKIEYDTTKPNGQYRKDISTSKFQSLFPTFEFTSYIEGIKKTYNKINESN